jgi:flagellar M-ring protein FliF
LNFEALFKQLVEFLNKLNKRQKIIIFGAVVAVVLVLTFLIVYNTAGSTNKQGYSILFQNLDTKDEALIVQYLDKKHIPYVLPSAGVIEVPSDMVQKVRLQVAAKGLPKNGKVGFELFDKSSFGATAFEENVKYLRALEGELANTIQSIDAVEDATVNIAIPKPSVFVSQQTPPTASVLVKLKPGMILTPQQIKGIKWLVAAAVPKLKPSNVKIIDQYGNILGENDQLTQNNQLLKIEALYTKNLEKSLENKIVSILAPIVGGANKVVAKVTVDIDFSQVQSKSTVYSPNNVVRSEQTIQESRIGVQPKPVGGVPGAVSNIGPVKGLKNSNVINKYTKSEDTTNYEISTTITDVKKPFAKIKRITAAVVVDGHYEKGKDGKIKFIPLTKQELSNIQTLVENAIGYDPKRGDSVTVSCFEFAQNDIAKHQSTIGKIMDSVNTYIGPISAVLKYLFLALVLFVFYKKVIVPFSQKMLEVKVEEEEEAPKEEVVIDEEEVESTYDKIKELKEKVEQQLGINSDVNEDELKYEVLLDRVTKMVEEYPEQVAKVLENLLKEEHPQS